MFLVRPDLSQEHTVCCHQKLKKPMKKGNKCERKNPTVRFNVHFVLKKGVVHSSQIN